MTFQSLLSWTYQWSRGICTFASQLPSPLAIVNSTKVEVRITFNERSFTLINRLEILLAPNKAEPSHRTKIPANPEEVDLPQARPFAWLVHTIPDALQD